MKVCILGRTEHLLNTAKQLYEEGYNIPVIISPRSEEYYKSSENDFKLFASEIGAKYYPKLSSPEVHSFILKESIDVAVSINWPSILTENDISLFDSGILNGHLGALPRYRGNACPNWAILNGEETVGITIHFMEPNVVDSGAIIETDIIEISKDTYVDQIYECAEELFPKMFSRALVKIGSRDFKGIEQSSLNITPHRTYPRRLSDSSINWSASANDIRRLIRASSMPGYAAFSFLEGDMRVSIRRASVYMSETHYNAVPGQVLGDIDSKPIIACGEGSICLESVCFDDGNDASSIIISTLRNRLIS